MVTEIVVPTDLKSDIKLSVGRWFKHVGDPVSRNEPLVEIDTDNLTREICASVTGVLSNVHLTIVAIFGICARNRPFSSA
jgi:pyruvate/2-oxoglutarate dehydrogenase complex dihydrolipoamide acyltransferase (E2) component